MTQLTTPYWASHEDIELMWKMEWTFRTCFEKNINDDEHYVTSDCPFLWHDIILKYGIRYCKSCNSWGKENISMKFSRIVEKFRYKSWDFGKKISISCQEITFCSAGHFSSHQVYIYAYIYSVRQKKYPLKFFAIFLATARNFYMKFHTFITHS